MTALELHTTEHGNPALVAVIGPLTAHTSTELHEHLSRILQSFVEGTEVHLDLSCCTNLDTDGVFALDLAHRTVSRRDIGLRLIRVPALFERLIRKNNFEHLL